MSVEFLQSPFVFPPAQISTTTSGTTTQKNSDFEAILKQTKEEITNAPPTVEQALVFLKVTQLQMMQGLFSSSDGEDEDEPLLNFSGNAPFGLLDAHKGHFIDKYRKNLPPLLSSTAPSGREQIDQMIERVAEKVSLAPELIRAVVTVESSFDPTAVSHAGAQGLMQLMPGTATELGVKDSFDPLENLTGGSRYLSQLLKKYSGDLDRALAAYNWGQGNVDRHGLEKMPMETRNYLAKVKQLLQNSNNA